MRRRRNNNARNSTKAQETAGSLRRLVQQMNDEVKLSEQTTRILTCSSDILRSTGTHLDSIGQTVRSGGKMVSKYARRETTDKILLAISLLLYVAVIYYILQKRGFSVMPSMFYLLL